MALLTIKGAAQRLGVSELTIRRRLRAGSLTGHQESRPQGFVWTVEVPDDMEELEEEPSEQETSDGVPGVLHELVATLQDQLNSQAKAHQAQLAAKDEQIKELHILLQQSQEQTSRMLPPPRQHRWWWPFSS